MTETIPIILLSCVIASLLLYVVSDFMLNRGKLVASNCWFGAIFIQLKYGGKIVMTYRPGTRIPHWVVINCNDGEDRHFTVIREVFPYPYGIALFWGRVEKY